MAATQRMTVVGVFEDRRRADQAVAELKRLGFRDDQIGVAMRHAQEGETSYSPAAEAGETHLEEGAAAGALTGLGLGALAGLGVLSGFIPVIGPAIAGGTLGIVLSNAAAGAATLGVAGALVGYGIPEDEAAYYNTEFEAGRTIVTVQADGRANEVESVMRRFDGYDMHTRANGASSSASAAATSTSTSAGKTARASGTAAGYKAGDTIQVKEERLHAEKHPVEAGEVHVRKEVHTETRNLEIPVQREEVVIERTPVHGRESVHAGEIREGEEIRIPVREEKVNVSKDTIVTEEVKVGKRVVQDTEHVAAQVRKEDVKVEQEGDVDVQTRGTGKHKK